MKNPITAAPNKNPSNNKTAIANMIVYSSLFENEEKFEWDLYFGLCLSSGFLMSEGGHWSTTLHPLGTSQGVEYSSHLLPSGETAYVIT